MRPLSHHHDSRGSRHSHHFFHPCVLSAPVRSAHFSGLPLWSLQEAHEQPYSGTIRGLVGSGLACCGFVVFRCVYGDDDEDDATWARFLDAMKRHAYAYARHEARQAFAQYLEPALFVNRDRGRGDAGQRNQRASATALCRLA